MPLYATRVATSGRGSCLPLAIRFAFRQSSRRISFHALQAFWYQVVWFAILCLALFLANVWAVVIEFFVFLAYPACAAYRVDRGFDYRYPVLANFIAKKRRPDAG